MMKELRYTLVTDGSSDVVLMPILTWLLQENGVFCAIQPAWADVRRIRSGGKLTLTQKISWSIETYPCDLLFVHRDAERESRENRLSEINKAIAELDTPPYVCVIPVRMQEAWLLINEAAIRRAAGNPNGTIPLNMPPINNLEKLSDPKQILHDLLKKASGLSGRRLNKFKVHKSASRIAKFIDDLSPLQNLNAFKELESDIKNFIQTSKW